MRTFDLDALVMPSRGKSIHLQLLQWNLSIPYRQNYYTGCTSWISGILYLFVVSFPKWSCVTSLLGFLSENTPPVRESHTDFPAPGIPFGIAFTSSSFTESKLFNFCF
jgi:hypothetical protein